jgi:hypothetical protein
MALGTLESASIPAAGVGWLVLSLLLAILFNQLIPTLCCIAALLIVLEQVEGFCRRETIVSCVLLYRQVVALS